MNIIHGLSGPLLSGIRSSALPPLYTKNVGRTDTANRQNISQTQYVVVVDQGEPPLSTVRLLLADAGRESVATARLTQIGEYLL